MLKFIARTYNAREDRVKNVPVNLLMENTCPTAIGYPTDSNYRYLKYMFTKWPICHPTPNSGHMCSEFDNLRRGHLVFSSGV